MKTVEEDVLDEYKVEEDQMYLDDEDMVDNDDLDAWTAAFNRGYKAA